MFVYHPKKLLSPQKTWYDLIISGLFDVQYNISTINLIQVDAIVSKQIEINNRWFVFYVEVIYTKSLAIGLWNNQSANNLHQYIGQCIIHLETISMEPHNKMWQWKICLIENICWSDYIEDNCCSINTQNENIDMRQR